jgi:hypothetical protein
LKSMTSFKTTEVPGSESESEVHMRKCSRKHQNLEKHNAMSSLY